MTVYIGCVLVANAVLLKMSSNYTGLGEILILMQSCSYWVIVNLMTKNRNFEIFYKMWTEFTESIVMWLGLALVVLTVFTLDAAIKIFFKIISPHDKTF